MSLTGKKILILGSDGFLGQNLARYFQQKGWDYRGLGRKEGDFSDSGLVDGLFKNLPPMDRIFHTITRQRTGAIQFQMQADLLTMNARVHLNILNAWAKYQPQSKLLSMGSSCAFPESDQPLPETSFQTGPLHPSVKGYGLAKQMLAAGSLMFAEQYKLSTLHCVLATMYGPYDYTTPERSHFYGGMLNRAVQEKAQGKTEFSVWGSPHTVRELLYVEDQIEAVLAADQKFENRILNCAANSPITIEQSAQAILAALEWKAQIVFPQASFQGTGYKVLDSSQFLNATGWKPKYSLIQGTRETIRIDAAAR